MSEDDKKQLRVRVTWGLGIFAILAIAYTLVLRSACSGKVPLGWAALVVIPVALLPPIWFWFEWAFLCDKAKSEEESRLIHTHELARNVWLGLAIVIGFILGIDFSG